MKISVIINANHVVTSYGICLSDTHIPISNGIIVETEVDVETIIGNYKLENGMLVEMTVEEKQIELDNIVIPKTELELLKELFAINQDTIDYRFTSVETTQTEIIDTMAVAMGVTL